MHGSRWDLEGVLRTGPASSDLTRLDSRVVEVQGRPAVEVLGTPADGENVDSATGPAGPRGATDDASSDGPWPCGGLVRHRPTPGTVLEDGLAATAGEWRWVRMAVRGSTDDLRLCQLAATDEHGVCPVTGTAGRDIYASALPDDAPDTTAADPLIEASLQAREALLQETGPQLLLVRAHDDHQTVVVRRPATPDVPA